ncbi:MAG: hypothetical protein MHM6MM_002004 [Cercozoa sp. M6MM]
MWFLVLGAFGASVIGYAFLMWADANKAKASVMPEVASHGHVFHWDKHEDYSSLMSKRFTPEVYRKLKGIRTNETGTTIEDVVKSGVEMPKSKIGAYATDEESYWRFSQLFYSIIADYHNNYNAYWSEHHSDLNPKKLYHRMDTEKMERYVLSTRIRVGRNIRGLGLTPGQNAWQRAQVAEIAKDALQFFRGELEGEYMPVKDMSDQLRQELERDHLMAGNDDPYLKAAGVYKDWPVGRGVFVNNAKNFAIQVGAEDSFRLISQEPGANFRRVFSRMVHGLSTLEKGITSLGYEYSWNRHLGFIQSCPSNLGTGLRCSVHVRLPNLVKSKRLNELIEKLQLELRSAVDEHAELTGDVVEISNKIRLGYTEVELVNKLIRGVEQLIEEEILLEQQAASEGVIVSETLPTKEKSSQQKPVVLKKEKRVGPQKSHLKRKKKTPKKEKKKSQKPDQLRALEPKLPKETTLEQSEEKTKILDESSYEQEAEEQPSQLLEELFVELESVGETE